MKAHSPVKKQSALKATMPWLESKIWLAHWQPQNFYEMAQKAGFGCLTALLLIFFFFIMISVTNEALQGCEEKK